MNSSVMDTLSKNDVNTLRRVLATADAHNTVPKRQKMKFSGSTSTSGRNYEMKNLVQDASRRSIMSVSM